MSQNTLMIIAILAAPLIAVFVNRAMVNGQYRKSRRLSIFQTLMQTRIEYNGRKHDDALDLISIEYPINRLFILSSKKNSKIIEARDKYLESKNQSLNENADEESKKNHIDKIRISQAKLLSLLGNSVGVKIDPIDLLPRNISSKQN